MCFFFLYFSQNPFKVFYRIGWNHKQGSGDLAGEPVEMENVKAKLVETLAKNQGYIDKYHIDMENIKVGRKSTKFLLSYVLTINLV